ncbi:M23 family metallopeptidase [Rhodococcus kroppenstedtii]|uniref:M23 family metallopeptidase n=1 Tax=Rhodococcoides kroppenstedtii TaxID=293050 RepID=UPI0029547090|nr:M23 family metallopeptidase [Rhodococcus kroppenstedtii]MDV7199621.1 M23 family metallopeptidase [Rhodococcus kroppenstedtii]
MAVALGAALAATGTGFAQASALPDGDDAPTVQPLAPQQFAEMLPDVLPPEAGAAAAAPLLDQLAKGRWLADRRAELEAQWAAAEAQRAADAERALTSLAVTPVSGTLTSDFGPRWGTTHTGLDIANEIGTPVYAAASGVVIDSGPASGFGLWVRLQHEDGSITTYGHIDRTLVSVGQQVLVGEQIATVGNRGQSTGPHLHFETADASGQKVDPKAWLRERGVDTTDLSVV